MTEVTNRNQRRAEIAANGWIIAWGDLINEGDVFQLVVFASVGAAGAWVDQQIQVQLKKLGQSLADVSEDVVKQATDYLKGLLRAKKSGERDYSGLGVKAGIVTYNRHMKTPFGKLPLANNHQPYIGVRITKPLPPRGTKAPPPTIPGQDSSLNRPTTVGRNLGSRLLLQNTTMYEGDYLQSENSLYRFILQGDGNVVLYAPNNEVVWTSKTDGKGGPPYRIVAQADGNIVQYDKSNVPLWKTDTGGSGGQVLVLQDDRNLVLYASGNKAVWQSRTYRG